MTAEERRYSSANSDLAARLFISVGGNEGWPVNARLAERFVNALETRDYPSREVHYCLVDGESHVSSVHGAISRALKTFFQSRWSRIRLVRAVPRTTVGPADFPIPIGRRSE